MHTTPARRAALALSVALVGGSVLAGAAYASDEPATSTTASPAASTPVQVTREHGSILEGYAVVGGTPVLITLYENSTHGSSLQVVVGDPEEDRIGYVEQAGAFIVEGNLDVTLPVGEEQLRLRGTVTGTGQLDPVDERVKDNGFQIITSGTHEQLAAQVTVDHAGESAGATFAPAIAYDLEVRKIRLYGGR
ncbi:MAG TPA: hypothetical protein VFO98_02890 [Marmoricola sp.]|nr:hypothetical protein [Marmoricola sp.]